MAFIEFVAQRYYRALLVASVVFPDRRPVTPGGAAAINVEGKKYW
jgi:hypothetical protein